MPSRAVSGMRREWEEVVARRFGRSAGSRRGQDCQSPKMFDFVRRQCARASVLHGSRCVGMYSLCIVARKAIVRCHYGIGVFF